MNKHRPISLSGIRGFLAAVKHMSFTRAAEDLHLTQSALSRQIQGLEEEIGKPLFIRNARRVALTPDGEEFARAARQGIKAMDECVSRLREDDTRRPVAVTTFGSFASLWLIPRLPTFANSHPDVDVSCLASERTVDLDKEGVDIALRAIPKPRASSAARLLFEEMIIPVCGSGLADTGRVPKSIADLSSHTLLRLDETIERMLPWLSWEPWFEQAGMGKIRPRATLRFSNFDQVIQAALSGQGIALARAPLVVELLLQKRLLMPLGCMKFPDRGYHLITSRVSMQREEVRDFVEWVENEAARTRQLLKIATRGIKRVAPNGSGL